MRKTFAIFLFSVFFCSQLGYFFMYALLRYEADEIMENCLFSSIKEKECDVINYSDDQQQIYWEEKDRTFVLNGNEYDVVKTRQIDGKTYLFCITETRECEMLSDMSSTYAVDHTNKTDSQLVLSLECILEPVNGKIDFNFRREKLYPANSSYVEMEKNIILPPPRPFSV